MQLKHFLLQLFLLNFFFSLSSDGGAAQPVGGTSASSPIFASIISLLNVASIDVTGKPLGFLNPFLYQMAAAEPLAFNDITASAFVKTKTEKESEELSEPDAIRRENNGRADECFGTRNK